MIPSVLSGSSQEHDSDNGSTPQITLPGAMGRILNGQRLQKLPIPWTGKRRSRKAEEGAA
jgi:hypothetical protein